MPGIVRLVIGSSSDQKARRKETEGCFQKNCFLAILQQSLMKNIPFATNLSLRKVSLNARISSDKNNFVAKYNHTLYSCNLGI